MQNQEAQTLLEKYKNGKASQAEVILLLDWIRTLNDHEQPDLSVDALNIIRTEIWQSMELPHVKTVRMNIWYRISAAAVILAAIGICAYFIINSPHKAPVIQPVTDAKPGGDKALLTLANGKTIALNNAKIGMLDSQATGRIRKTGSGLVIFMTADADQPATGTDKDQPTVISTPKGGQWSVELADGTKVRLNSLSSIRIPHNFSSETRRIEMTGEVFFQVKHDPAHPFSVVAGEALVEDIGTSFNINAYKDEPSIKTTLVEGAASVKARGARVLLKPGQQAVYASSLKVSEADLEEALAWKNDYFIFNNEELGSIMRKVARWYDVEVSFQGGIEKERFIGSVSRFKSVSAVLRKLEATGTVHFKIEEGRIIAMP